MQQLTDNQDDRAVAVAEISEVSASFATSEGNQGIVVSDLHLFAGRSVGQSLFDGTLTTLESQRVLTLVLNGDTFDFRWSELTTREASVDAAIRWLSDLLNRLPDVHVHFLLGNHDCLEEFVVKLTRWADDHRNFTIHPHRLQLGNTLFLHGDVANRRMDEASLLKFRAAWEEDRPKGKLAKKMYGLADQSGISRAFHRLYFPINRTCAKVAFHLDTVQPAWRESVTEVYFGHTHCPIASHTLDGVKFFNTGSGIQGMGYAPQHFLIAS